LADSPGALQELGWTCLCARSYDEAIEAFGRVLAADPKNTYTRSWMADAYALKDECERFIAQCDTLKRLGTDGRYYSYALCGDPSKALARIEELRAEAERGYVEPVYFAIYYAVLGEGDQAFHWLRKAFEARSVGMVRIMKADPFFDGLHSDPRWSELLRMMKFPEGSS
jgi:tetratricopeptide (TPR) repeat protein